MNRSFAILLSAAALAGVFAPVAAQDTRVDIAASSISTHTPPDSSDAPYYTLSVTVPRGVEAVRYAWLELRMDVSVRDVDGFSDPAPMLRVFMLNGALTGEPTVTSFVRLRTPMSRPVATGSNRRVRIDITEYVNRILSNPGANHGLFFGPVADARRASFQPREDGFGPGVVARVTLVR